MKALAAVEPGQKLGDARRGGPERKSPRCHTSSSGATAAFQRSTSAASWAGIEGNGRRSMRRTRGSPKWVSLVKNVVIERVICYLESAPIHRRPPQDAGCPTPHH